MRPRSIASALAAATAATLAFGPGAAGAAVRPRLVRDAVGQSSSNWSGYAVTGRTPFTSVSGSWVQPSARCARGAPGDAAFWVGLGGFADRSSPLEQIGTETDCTASGAVRTSVWYELVPTPSVAVRLRVKPGDTIFADVDVDGSEVVLSIADTTTGASFTKTAAVGSPDTSSAEWIAEVPSTCGGRRRCVALPLANFGTIGFDSASATAAGHSGTIADPAWSATAVTLRGAGPARFDGSRFARFRAGADAVPTRLSADGASFSIAWRQPPAPPPRGDRRPESSRRAR